MVKTRTSTSPSASRTTWKPGVFDEDLPFFQCSICGAVLTGISGTEQSHYSEEGRRPIINLPYAPFPALPTCCNKQLIKLEAKISPNVLRTIGLSYEIVGGFDTNTLRVSWEPNEKYQPQWIALKTFTGTQLKYVLPGKMSPLVFAFADEDAYVYCNEDPCVACTFRCKRGFILYAFSEIEGLIKIPLHYEPIN